MPLIKEDDIMDLDNTKVRTEDEIIEAVISRLQNIYDPEIPVSIYDLGLIYDIKLEVKQNYTYCTITMTLTSPGCPASDSIANDVYYYTVTIPEIDEVKIDIVFSPPWDFSFISKEGKEILELDGTVIPQY